MPCLAVFHCHLLKDLWDEHIKRFPGVIPNLQKDWDVYNHAYVTGAQKRTHVDHQNIPNHYTSTYVVCGILGMYGC